jgi:plastocyanin domain-containing protein
MNAIINIAGVLLIALIIWWFWLSKPKAIKQTSDVIDVLVDNGVYTPAHIEVAQGKPLTLRFVRKDASPCAEKVIFVDLGINVDLPLGHALEVKIPTERAGSFDFTCQMQMYRGKLTVSK